MENLEAVKGRELAFAGIVNEKQDRFTKNGKPFGQFNLEDYDSNHRFFIFGEEYLKFKNHLVNGWFIYVKGKVQPRKFAKDPSEIEFRIHTIELLSDVKEKYAKHLNIKLPLGHITDEFTDQLHKIMSEHSGSTRVKMFVRDIDAEITMPAKNLKVDLSKELISELEKIPQLELFVD